jgi:hypothetical protein
MPCEVLNLVLVSALCAANFHFLPNVTDEPTGPASFDRWRLSDKGRTINPLALAAGSPFGTGELNFSCAAAYRMTEILTGQCGFRRLAGIAQLLTSKVIR